jgi:hypothetical protein
MKAYLRGESQWALTESEQKPEAYPTTIEGEQFTEVQLRKKKASACRAITMAVADDLVDMVAGHIDPANAWKALKDQFHSGNQSQILTLMGQLQTLRLPEGGSIEDYTKKA